MQLHIIGGFLGSGKTTAIIGASKYLAQLGKKVGVITNDQGKHLVDTAILKAENLPALEVGGGCFCCHFDDLNDRLRDLVDEYHPDVIFAESVGSCADVVATVVKPLLELEIGAVKPNSFSVFTDIRLLRRFLLEMEMPFSDGVTYIFGKQIEEAGLLVINKTDLVNEEEKIAVENLARGQYPDIPIRLQSAFHVQDIQDWVEALMAGDYPPFIKVLDIDYDQYAAAEGRMAWIERRYILSTHPEKMQEFVVDILNKWQLLAKTNKWVDGHIKAVLQTEDGFKKLSVAQSDETTTIESIEMIQSDERFKESKVELLVNVLVEGDLDVIGNEIENAVSEAAAVNNARFKLSDSFNRRPGYPKPSYRITK